jgi:hypothetical protein
MQPAKVRLMAGLPIRLQWQRLPGWGSPVGLTPTAGCRGNAGDRPCGEQIVLPEVLFPESQKEIRMRTRFVAPGVLVALAILPALGRAAEEAPKTPTVVLRLAALDDLISDARWIATQAGREEQAKQAVGFLKLFTGPKGLEGVDTKRPIGLYVFAGPNGIDSEGVLMVPIADEQGFMALLKRLMLKPEKDKDGVYTVQPENSPVPIHFRFANKYLYAAVSVSPGQNPKAPLTTARLLTPAIMFPGKFGAVSATLNMSGVPKEIRTMILGQVEMRLAELKEKENRNETPAQTAFRKKTIDEVSRTLKALLAEGGRGTAQVTVDQKASTLTASVTFTPKSGTDLARRIKGVAETSSIVAGLISKDSAASGRLTVSLPEELRKAAANGVDDTLAQMLRGVKDETGRGLLERYFKALSPTIKAGTLDGAFDLRGPSEKKLYTVVLGLQLKEGQQLEKAVRATVEKIPARDRDKINLDAARVGGVNIHRVNVGKQMNEGTRQTFGENPVYFAIRDDAVYFALGDKGLEALKEAVAAKPSTGPVMRLDMSLAQLVPLLARNPKQKDAPEAAREAFAKDPKGDRIRVILHGGESLQFRLTIKGGVIRFGSLMEKADREKREQNQ